MTIPAQRQVWVSMTLICFFGMLSYLDRMLLAGAMPLVKREFQLTDTEVGLTSVAFAVVYAICGLFFGRLADKYPRRWILVLTVAFWSLMTAAFGMSHTFALLLLTRAAVALGEAGYSPAAYSTISDLFTPARRNFAFGLFLAMGSLGTILGLSLGGVLSQHFGWRACFLMFGIPGILLAIAAAILIKEPVRGGLDPKELVTGGEANAARALLALLKNAMFVWLCLVTAFGGFLTVGIAQWLPSFFERTYGLSVATVGLLCGLALGVGLGIGQLTGGSLAARIAKRGVFEPLKICLYANLLLVPLLLGAFWAPNFLLSAGLVMAAAIVGGAAHAPKFAAMQNGIDPRLRGMALGVSILLGAIFGMAVGPLVVGILSDAFLPSVGESQSLRYALTCSLVLFLLAAISAGQAYRAAVRGQARAAAVQAAT